METALVTLKGVDAKYAPTKLSNSHVSLYPSYLPVNQTPSTATAMLTVSLVYLNEINSDAGGTINKTAVPTSDALRSLIDYARISTPTSPMIDPHMYVCLCSPFILINSIWVVLTLKQRSTMLKINEKSALPKQMSSGAAFFGPLTKYLEYISK